MANEWEISLHKINIKDFFLKTNVNQDTQQKYQDRSIVWFNDALLNTELVSFLVHHGVENNDAAHW